MKMTRLRGRSTATGLAPRTTHVAAVASSRPCSARRPRRRRDSPFGLSLRRSRRGVIAPPQNIHVAPAAPRPASTDRPPPISLAAGTASTRGASGSRARCSGDGYSRRADIPLTNPGDLETGRGDDVDRPWGRVRNGARTAEIGSMPAGGGGVGPALREQSDASGGLAKGHAAVRAPRGRFAYPAAAASPPPRNIHVAAAAVPRPAPQMTDTAKINPKRVAGRLAAPPRSFRGMSSRRGVAASTEYPRGSRSGATTRPSNGRHRKNQSERVAGRRAAPRRDADIPRNSGRDADSSVETGAGTAPPSSRSCCIGAWSGAANRAVPKLHRVFKMLFLCVLRGAGVCLNMLSEFWRNLRADGFAS